MSKHQKELRRERRKTDRARRLMARFRHPTSAIKHGAAALAAAAVIAAGTQAYAAPVRFDNPADGEPGHFHWPINGTKLDFSVSASEQTGAGSGPTLINQALFTSYGGIGKLVGSNFWSQSFLVGGPAYSLVDFLIPLGAGEMIPTTDPYWDADATSTIRHFYAPESLLPENEPVYLGHRFDGGAGLQYAWIGVVRDNHKLEAFAWGYETEVGVPIGAGVPEPGSLALLAFGATAALRRRRRR